MWSIVFAIPIEHIPLKQGLRPVVSGCVANNNLLIEHIPLEQGLR